MGIEEISLLIVGVLIVVIVVSALSKRIGIATPLSLVVVGIGIGFIPGVPTFEIDPQIILLGVLPPLLYAAAVNVPMVDLRRNLGPVTALSVVLVIISAFAVGFVLHWLVPAIPLPVAIALGAVVSPTDAVAATAIGKKMGLPPRLVTILEGESLVNDATSLVLLRTAIIATSGTFVFWEAAGSFVFAVVLALIIGYLIGMATVWVRSKMANPVYDTVASFAVPFIAFIPTEYIGASGVLAVVVTGLYTGHHAAKKFSATARVNEKLNWRTALFILENGVFLVMGLQLHALVNDVAESSFTIDHLLLLSAAVVLVLIAVRMLFMWPLTIAISREVPIQQAKARGIHNLTQRVEHQTAGEESTSSGLIMLEKIDRRAKKSAADLAHAHTQGLDWRGATILGWSGMRGVVTLAAAQSIPESVPYRSQIVLIAFFAAVSTLLLHGLTLPVMIRKLRPSGPTAEQRNHEYIVLYQELTKAGHEALEETVAADTAAAAHDDSIVVPSEAVRSRVNTSVLNSLSPLAFSLIPQTRSTEAQSDKARKAEEDARTYLRLAHVALEAQRSILLEERTIGQFSSDALRAAAETLDAYELRLTPPAAD